MTDNLLPCPFCGGEPEYSRRQDECLWSHDIVWWDKVSCGNCDIQFSWPEQGTEDGTAMQQWNTRHKPETHPDFEQWWNSLDAWPTPLKYGCEQAFIAGMIARKREKF